MLRGLPASGKTTWAKKQLDLGGYFRISLKDIEENIIGKNSKKRKMLARKYRREMVEDIMSNNKGNIILDDYNLSINFEREIEKLCLEYGYDFILNDSFLEVSVKECVGRDLKRHDSIGQHKIQKLYNELIAPKYQRNLESNFKKKRAVIVSLDKTPRLEPNYFILSIIDSLQETFGGVYLDVIFLVNSHNCNEFTEWADKYLIDYSKVITRDISEEPSITDFKLQEILKIEEEYAILGIIEENEVIATTWEQMGYNVLKTRGVSKG